MATNSGIEWTEATWNPTSGCSKISPGCKNCYAETMTKRLLAMGQQKYNKGFKYVEHPSDVSLPASWKKSKKIFVNSMSDLFHEKSTFEFTGRCFATMIRADWHDYQILTKRPKRMAEFSKLFVKYFAHKIPNYIWMGTSIESSEYVSRINDLQKVRCHTRFISFEPLLESVGRVNLRGIDWVIIGGESGHHYRPVQKEWIEDIINQCTRQEVAVFFKQWGGPRPKSGGRTINGKKYDQYPKIKRRNSLKDVHFDESAFAEMCLVHESQKRILLAK
ncbi:MAG: phage Gp37/Gp68 family protein [Nitrosopumilus sp. B06]|nr:MAG: phage Gp37/Gp68 family protein [Nitrosopumilus sp. B06]